MKLLKKYFLLLIYLLFIPSFLISCLSEQAHETIAFPQEYETAKVNMALPLTEVSSLGAIAIEKGCFEKYGIDISLTMYDDPSAINSMEFDNGYLDIAYVEAPEAWHTINSTKNQVSYVFFDNLRNSPQLLAQNGIFEDVNDDNIFTSEELYEGLKGSTVFMDVGSFSGVWFWNLIDMINIGKEETDKLWIVCDVLLDQDDKVKNDNPDYLVTVTNYDNSLLPVAMSTDNDEVIKLAVTDFSVTVDTLNSNKNILSVASNAFFPTLDSSSGVWVASNEWLSKEPDVAERVINALYESTLDTTNISEASLGSLEYPFEESYEFKFFHKSIETIN